MVFEMIMEGSGRGSAMEQVFSNLYLYGAMNRSVKSSCGAEWFLYSKKLDNDDRVEARTPVEGNHI